MFVPPISAGSFPCRTSWTFLWTRRTARWNVGLARSCNVSISSPTSINGENAVLEGTEGERTLAVNQIYGRYVSLYLGAGANGIGLTSKKRSHILKSVSPSLCAFVGL